jgi:glycosyltransferase involved in cell wall biosynthesis
MMTDQAPVDLALVVPCFNEEEVLLVTAERVAGLKLSRNRGHQNALLAGLLSAPGEAVISLDADLQDDISVIPEMLQRFREGLDVVYGVRRSRSNDS